MNWDLLDFLAFGAMITVALLVINVLRKRSRVPSYRWAVIVATLGAFLMVWSNAAVGLIGNEENSANLLFFGVLGVAVIGALVARFHAKGMSLALYATATAQVLVALYAIVMDLGASGPIWPRDILTITAVFTVFWLLSGWLFGRAAKAQRRLFVDRGLQ